MKNPVRVKEFENAVKNKFNVYNSLFLNLPFSKISNTGVMIPLMQKICEQGLKKGKDPAQILDSFFEVHANLKSEEEKIDFMFRVIQYIERQIVLYDSVEDAAFSYLMKMEDYLSLKDYMLISDNSVKRKEIIEKLSDFTARIVFTAHPTQFYSPAVLDIIARLRQLISDNDINGIDITLQQLGLTSLINSKKPTPYDEARNIIYFLRGVYYQAIGELYRHIKDILPGGQFDNPKIIQLGFWPGGDRDGNPYVNCEITNAVADELRMTLMKCYYHDVKKLGFKLTFRQIEDEISHLRNKLYVSMFDADKILAYDDIINPLLHIRKSVVQKFNGLYLEELDMLIDKVKIFRTHFASLDIRQHHNIHKITVEKILVHSGIIKKNIEELSKEELISVLVSKRIKIILNRYDDDLVIDTIRSVKLMKEIQKKNGEEGCNRYIISNSEDIYSVLFVYALFRWCLPDKEELTVDIIPLFESMEGMKNSESIMRELLSIPGYRSHIRNRNNYQTIMLGFSDGTKDGGYLQANWSIFKTKEKLSEVCSEFNIKPVFFDGRGGPPARGGGKTHRFYAAQTNRIANHAIQLTIQGQTITSKYGTKEHFKYNSEQLITAGLSNSIFEKENVISDESRELIEKMALISFEKYNALKNHELFIPYLENKSTLKYYGKTNIGSRPTKRGNKDKLDLNDLRAIPFVGSWSQLKQNVPGYYGMGTALHSIIKKGGEEKLKTLFNEVPFFKALILNCMMSLSKCNFDLTRYFMKDKEYRNFWKMLYDEFELTKKMVLLITGQDILMDEEPFARNSIAIREKLVLPLLVIQQYALQKVEQKPNNKSVYEKIVRRSLYGNINASRNSA